MSMHIQTALGGIFEQQDLSTAPITAVMRPIITAVATHVHSAAFADVWRVPKGRAKR